MNQQPERDASQPDGSHDIEKKEIATISLSGLVVGIIADFLAIVGGFLIVPTLVSPPLTDVQTISVPPGGAWMVKLQVDVPGQYILVDHALSRAERGLVGYLADTGKEQPEIFHEEPAGR